MKKYVIKFITLVLALALTPNLVLCACGAQSPEATAPNEPTAQFAVTPGIITPGIITPGIIIPDPITIGRFIPVDTTDWPEPVASVTEQIVDRRPVSKHSFQAFLESNNDGPKPVASVTEQIVDRRPVSKHSFQAFLESNNDGNEIPCIKDKFSLKK